MAPKVKKVETKKEDKNGVSYVMAREGDGTIQITYTLSLDLIEKEKTHAATELAKDIEVPGFRKGKAPLDQAISKINSEKLIQTLLSHILPKAFGDTIDKEKIRPIIYPKFELIKAEDGKPWEIRALTCELPQVSLGNFKAKITGAAKAKAIWTPGKDDPDKKPAEPTLAEKESQVLQILLSEAKVEVPKFLVEDEANNKLSQLLERLEKLGLTLESYLASIGKNPEAIRAEYAQVAISTLKLDFILAEISKLEKITADQKDVDEAIKSLSADPKLKDKYDTPEQRRMVESIIIKRKTLDYLISLL